MAWVFKWFTFDGTIQILCFATFITHINFVIGEQNVGLKTCGSKNSISHVEHGNECVSSDLLNKDREFGAQKYKKYANEKWETYLQNIETAKSMYSSANDTSSKSSSGKSKSCSIYTSLIHQDLSVFSNGISKDMIDKAKPRGTLYQIIDGKLFRDDNCKFPSRCKGIEHFLLKIVDKLPNMEFVINVSDWPQVSSWLPNPTPVLSFSKTKEYVDITYPAWTFWEGGPAIGVYPKGIGRWDLLRQSLIQTTKKFPWSKKESKVFFRGSRTSSERDTLVYLSRKQPNIVDAKYTKNQAWKSDADTLNAPAAAEVPLEDHCQYKYLFNYRGVAASFRFKHLFLCNSLVFHVGNEWIEFFYHALIPWYHYIPVERNADENEIQSLIEFVRAHDDIAKEIAKRGYRFIESHLKLKEVKCYWRELLSEYGKLLKYSVQPGQNMAEIK